MHCTIVTVLALPCYHISCTSFIPFFQFCVIWPFWSCFRVTVYTVYCIHIHFITYMWPTVVQSDLVFPHHIHMESTVEFSLCLCDSTWATFTNVELLYVQYTSSHKSLLWADICIFWVNLILHWTSYSDIGDCYDICMVYDVFLPYIKVSKSASSTVSM